MHIFQIKREEKLDEKWENCIFFCVSEESKAYNLYNPVTKKIVISRDVIFEEERFWTWNKNNARQQILAEFDGENERQQFVNDLQLVENEQQPIAEDSPSPAGVVNELEKDRHGWLIMRYLEMIHLSIHLHILLFFHIVIL